MFFFKKKSFVYKFGNKLKVLRGEISIESHRIHKMNFQKKKVTFYLGCGSYINFSLYTITSHS